MDVKGKSEEILERLENEHHDAKIALQYNDPLELLVATILSAQCTDERVNLVTASLFKSYRTAEDYANADLADLELRVRPTGFYHNKAKNIKSAAEMIVEEYGSNVPKNMEELIRLPGVARKTANIVLANAFGVIEGIAVDTHVKRLSNRLGLTENSDPEKIEKDLMKILRKNIWARFTDLLIFHGREICTARNPKCNQCVLSDLCPSAFKFNR